MDYHIRNLNDPDPKVPDDSLNALQCLWASSDPFDHDSTDDIFLEAVKESIIWHMSNSGYFRDWMDRDGFNIGSLRTSADLCKIPFLHANFYKTHIVKDREDDDYLLTLTSSGTTGQKSQMFFDKWTLTAMDKTSDIENQYYGYITNEPVNFMMYAYEPVEGFNVGTLRTRLAMMRYAKANETFYALRYTGSGHEFDPFGSIDALLRFEKEGLPVRILGFPAFLYFTLEMMEKMGYPPLKLNERSMVVAGGGWKGFTDKQMDPEKFRNYIGARLGIPESRCIESYGAVEHGVAYIQCPNHHFHVPIYSRVIIRDTETLEPLSFGKIGFLNVISPMNTGVPVVSLLMGDLAILHEGCECGCGTNAPWFEIIGRAGTSKNRSCAVAAAELLRR